MNINRALIVVFILLSLLGVITVINLHRSKSIQYDVYENTDDDALMQNIQWAPEIIRSFEKVKEVKNRIQVSGGN